MNHEITLIAREDAETGELGLMIEGTPVIQYPMVANEGLLVAHDLIEHQQGPESIGSIGDELIALGAVWFTRGHIGDLRRDSIGSAHSPESNLASDVANMARLYRDGVPLRIEIPETEPHDQDQAFFDIMREARREYLSEARHDCGYDGETWAGVPAIDGYWRAVIPLLRHGWNLALARFGAWERANSIFWNIAAAVDPYCKPEFEGQTFTLNWNDDEAHCCEDWPEDYDED